jgi:transcriptional regulator with XRE-family HTH domain
MALLMGESLLRKRLKERKMTQRTFAKLLGVGYPFVSMIISGERKFSYQRSINAAEILDCHPRDLYEWTEVPLSELQEGEE